MLSMISAVILTHNSEKSLASTLDSLSWCDERIVIDDESIDKTVAIAKSSNTNIFSRRLAGDFAAQRNFGLSKAIGPWVLFVDSDEVVTKELADEVRRAVRQCEGYYIKRIDFLWGRELKHGETANVKLLRLAKKDAGCWTRPVHEVWDVKGKTGELSSPLFHYPHPNVAQFLEKINTYSSLNAEFLYSQKIRSNWFEILVYPIAKFFRNYFFHMGFLDGTAGAVVAIMMSFHSFLTRAKLYQAWNKSHL